MKVIAIVGGKGGIGKTYTTLSLATELGLKNYRVLIADFDPSENSSTKIAKVENKTYDASNMFSDKKFDIRQAIFPASENFPNVDIMIGSDRLDFVDNLISGRANTDHILKRSLKKIEDEYDFCIIDCPPNRGTVVINAIIACHAYLTPFTIEVAAIDGVLAIEKLVDWLIDEGSFSEPPINLGAFCSDYISPNSRATKKILEIAEEMLNECLLDIRIPTCTHAREAGIHNSTLQHDRSHKVCIEYIRLTDHIISTIK